MRLAFIVCLIAHLIVFSHQDANFRVGNTAFFREQIGQATIAEKLKVPKCDSHFLNYEMEYQEDNILMQKYVENECGKRGLWFETDVPGEVAGLKSPSRKGLSKEINTSDETFSPREERVGKETAYLKWLMSNDERRDSRRYKQMEISNLLNGRLGEDILEKVLPQDMLDVYYEMLPGAYQVSVTNCTTKRIEYNVCIGWKMITNQVLYKVAHEGLLGENSFTYFDGFAVHFGEENKEKMEPTDFTDCVFSKSRYLCMKAENLCAVPGGTNCKLKVVDAPADFELVRSMRTFQLITTRNQTYTVNNEVYEVPRSGTMAIPLKKDAPPVAATTITSRQPIYYHVITSLEDEETRRLNAEFEKHRKEAEDAREEFEVLMKKFRG